MADKNKYTIKDYPLAMRPRERMEKMGAEALSDRELLALLLSTGTKEYNALELADILLNECQGIRGLPALSLTELSSFKGVGNGKGARILAALEIGKRISLSTGEYRPEIKTCQDAANLLMDDLTHSDREIVKIILLNTKNKVLGIETIAIGGLSHAAVHPREVYKIAIKKSAYAIIVAHNHPSGEIEPSQADHEITMRLKNAGEVIGIPVLDHIIIGDRCYFSFKENRLI